jgi:signal transduction histidine kinase
MRSDERITAMSSGGQRIYSLERRSLFLLSLLFSFCIIFGIACLIAYNSYRKATEATIRSNETRANLLAKLILEHQRAAIGVIRSYAGEASLVNSVERKDFEGALRQLTDLLKNNPEAEWPFITNPEGTVWVNFPVDQRALNKNLSYGDWYKGVSREWKPYISCVYKMMVGEQDLAVVVSAPIFDKEGKVIGILNTAQSTAFFQKIFSEVSSNSDANMTLIDQEGHIIYSSRFPYTKEVVGYPSFDFVRRAMRGEKGDVEIRNPSGGDRSKYVSFAPVEGIGWSIIIEKAKSEVLRSEYPFFALIAAIAFLTYAGLVLYLVHLRERQRKLAELGKLNTELEENTVQLRATNKALENEIAKRKRMEEALIESEGRFRVAAEGSLDAFFIFRSIRNEMGKITDFEFVDLNARAEKLIAMPKEKVIGQKLCELIPINRTGGFFDKYVRVVETGETLDEEFCVASEQIQASWIHHQVVQLTDGVAITSRDITDRKRAEEEIRELNHALQQHAGQLEAANEEVEAFTYSVSHDLRAPLRAVDGYTRILLEDYAAHLNEEAQSICGKICDGAQRMGKLIDDLLAFSRLSRAEMQTSSIDMHTLANSAFLELTTPESRNSLDFRLQPLPRVDGDPTMVRQIWMNLISNAIKFSSKRERPVIEVGCHEEAKETIYYIRDNGAGFDKQYVHKLFRVFQRLHSTREFEGTGVGLAIVRRIAHRHGGCTWADGETDKGATFYFTMPKRGEGDE